MLSRYTYQWLYNVGMHFNAEVDQNLPCGSRFIIIYTNCYLIDRRAVGNIFTNCKSTDGIEQIQGSCNLISGV